MTMEHISVDLSDEQRLREENARLRASVMALRSRLEEPAEILRALRNGEVDAFVVSEGGREQIYTLRSADVLYRRMVEDMKEGAVALDAAGVIVYCNAYFARLLRAGREDVLGESVMAFIPKEERSFVHALCAEASNGTSRQELTLRAKGGELVSVSATMNRIQVDGDDLFCFILTDLSEQKHREELQAESRRKDEFLAMLSHELRNPLAPIRNATQILRLNASSDSEGQWAADVIERQVTQLTRLVDDLLDVSRITRGKMRLLREAVDLAVVVARGLETARPLVEARQHTLTVDLPSRPLWVRADAARLAQIVANLLNNAAKFTPTKGHIWLAVEPQGEGEARIVVRDSGIGIAPEMLPRIFDLFTQADSTPERSQGGLGIGLTLVRSLVEMHGGSVRAHSAGPGQGCEFVVTLPLWVEAVPPPEPGEVERPTSTTVGAPQRVLVIDDNLDAGESLTLLLQHLGHDARLVTDADRALEEARTFRPQVIFLDIGLPGTSGYEIARQLRRSAELENVALVALTGYGQEEDRRLSREAGFDHHWVKPVDPGILEAFLACFTCPGRGA